jgi:tetratricopeptide (TPR) repeat protein
MSIHVHSLLSQAFKDFQNGNLQQAKKLFSTVLKIQPKNFDALHIMGVINGIENNHKDALSFFKKAVKINPNNNFAQFNLSKALAEMGLEAEALKHISIAVKLEANHAESWLNYGKILSKLKNPNEALNCYNKAIKLKPNFIEALYNKGVILNELNQFEEALANYNEAIQLDPAFAAAWFNRGVTNTHLLKFEDAIDDYKKTIQLNPTHTDAWFNCGVLLNELKRFDEALIHYEKAIQINPSDPKGWTNKGVTLNDVKRYEEALFHHEKAIQLTPTDHKPWANKGVTLKNLKRYDEAIHHYDQAIKLNPEYAEAQNNRALLNLSLKKFQQGWEDYNARLKVLDFKFPTPPTSLPLWDGITHPNHLLIIGEQGIGDEIFYLSMLDKLKNKASNISMLTDKRLISILKRSFPRIAFLEKSTTLNFALFDYQIPLGNLPIIFSVDPSNSNTPWEPYITDNSETTKSLKNSQQFQNKFTCGIAWKSANKKLGADKSISLSAFKEILETPNCQFINLQYGEVNEDIKLAESTCKTRILSVDDIDLFENIDGLLSIIKACDMIITTSNVTAHLAGALGKKTLLLAPNSQGKIWYWHDEPQNSWYPSIQQFFQSEDFDWSEAISNVAKELKKEINGEN